MLPLDEASPRWEAGGPSLQADTASVVVPFRSVPVPAACIHRRLAGGVVGCDQQAAGRRLTQRCTVSSSWSRRKGLNSTRSTPAWRAFTIEWPGS